MGMMKTTTKNMPDGIQDRVLHLTHEQCEEMSAYVGMDIVCGLPSEVVDCFPC